MSEVEFSSQEQRVIIAIVSTKDVHHIVGCLESLAASTHRSFSVIICENGGAEAFRRLVNTVGELNFISESNPSCGGSSPTTLPGKHIFVLGEGAQCVRVLNPGRNLGYAGGVNACICAASSEPWDAVWVLNPDTFPDREALAALVHRQRAGDYGMVGSRLLATSDGLVQTWGGMKWWSLASRGFSLGRNKPGDATPDIVEVEKSLDFLSGASMYVSRAYIETVGVMDEDFFVYCEDVDWCLRHGNFRLGYAHDSIVRHVSGGTSGKFSSSGSRFTVYLGTRNAILLARKFHGRSWPIFAAIVLNTVLIEQLLRARSFRRFGFALDGWWAGVRDERGAPYFI